MKKREAKKFAESEIPEVMAFVTAQSDLQEFKQEHAAIFLKLEQLVDQYNTRLEAANQVCRSEGVSCGPFQLYQFTTKYNAEALFNSVGRDKFLELGGQVKTETAYSIDKAKFEAMVAQNKVNPDVVATVRTETPNFHKPEKIVLP